jgi:hypothetical protein
LLRAKSLSGPSKRALEGQQMLPKNQRRIDALMVEVKDMATGRIKASNRRMDEIEAEVTATEASDRRSFGNRVMAGSCSETRES